MGRNPKLAVDGKAWVKAGGYVDFTADDPVSVDYIVDYISMFPLAASSLFEF